MQFQAILLSVVILISLFITESPPGGYELGVIQNTERAIFDFPGKAMAFINELIPKIDSAQLKIETKETEENPLPQPIASSSPQEAVASSSIEIQDLMEEKVSCQPESLPLTGKSILVKYPEYNILIYEKESKKHWPIASVTKLMSSVIASEKIDSEAQITITDQAVAEEGSAGNFKTGEVFKAKDLIKAMLVISSNDAALVLAEFFGNDKFTAEMTKKAKELGMDETNYVEPTGLSFLNQSTTSDLEKLVNYIQEKHPEIFKITEQKEIKIIELNTRKSRILNNINIFAGEPDFLGGKTGYTEASGRNLLALFNIQRKRVLIITLGAENAFDDARYLKDMISSCSLSNN